ncbi:MAG: hypothetical protein QOG68_1422 [Solirubrobacteraceae bacterium]|nr:hypothetical protein [Solirubrobacteraceae bacterium]
MLAVALLAVIGCGSAPAADVEPQAFSPHSVWDLPLPADQAPDPRSAALVSNLRWQVSTYGPWIATNGYTAPVYTVGADQPLVPVILDTPKEPLRTQLAAGVPMPPDARGSWGSDGSAIVWQPSTDTYWEFWRLSKHRDGSFHATFGGMILHASTSDGLLRDGTGTAASGLALLGGLMRPGEFGAGTIRHALRIGVPQVAPWIIRAPATRTDGRYTGGIPMGTRFQLDPSVNICDLDVPSQVKTIAYAAQRYGLIVGDSSGAVAFYGEDPLTMDSDPWPALFGGQTPSALLRQFPWDKLRALPPLTS